MAKMSVNLNAGMHKDEATIEKYQPEETFYYKTKFSK